MKAARWAVLGLLSVSILVLVFALGYVFRGDSKSSPAADAPTGSATADASTALSADDFKNLNQILKILQDKYVDPDLVDKSVYRIQGLDVELTGNDRHHQNMGHRKGGPLGRCIPSAGIDDDPVIIPGHLQNPFPDALPA